MFAFLTSDLIFFGFPFSTNQHDILAINIFQDSQNDPRLSSFSKILRLYLKLGPATHVGELPGGLNPVWSRRELKELLILSVTCSETIGMKFQ